MLSTIAGEYRLGADPELRFTPSGKGVCTLRVVNAARKKNDDGSWEDTRTTWVTAELWGQPGENVVESLKSGDLCVIVGKFFIDEWTDNEGGKRQTPKIMVDFIGPSLSWATAKVTKAQRQSQSGGGQQQQQRPADNDPWSTGPAQTDEPPF